MKHSAEYYIEHLEMEPHVEGGYFKECPVSYTHLTLPTT